MISYREKELMTVLKFLNDRSDSFSEMICKMQSDMSDVNICENALSPLPEIESYSDIVDFAKSEGYSTYIRVDDILSSDELKSLESNYEKIEEEFEKVTKLNNVDAAFVISATALQLIRQVVQPHLDIENLQKIHKDSANETKWANKAKRERAIEREIEQEIQEHINNSGYYYAKLEEIAEISKVPYDQIAGTNDFGVSLNDDNHINLTLGQDPWLGYIFGTCNILTNTMTLSKNNQFKTLHVKNNAAVAEADVIKMLLHSCMRYEESRTIVVLALLKQIYHIKSNGDSDKHLSLPFLRLLCDAEILQDLSDPEFDYGSVKTALHTVAKQAAFAEFINYIICVAHRIHLAIEENNASDNRVPTLEAIKKYRVFNKEDKVSEVRTRKVLLISDSIASSINIAAVAGMAIGGVVIESEKLEELAVKYFDVGGLIVTVWHLFSDSRFITKIKKEFIAKAIDGDFQKFLNENGLIERKC